jgi:hypothetical protein
VAKELLGQYASSITLDGVQITMKRSHLSPTGAQPTSPGRLQRVQSSLTQEVSEFSDLVVWYAQYYVASVLHDSFRAWHSAVLMHEEDVRLMEEYQFRQSHSGLGVFPLTNLYVTPRLMVGWSIFLHCERGAYHFPFNA